MHPTPKPGGKPWEFKRYQDFLSIIHRSQTQLLQTCFRSWRVALCRGIVHVLAEHGGSRASPQHRSRVRVVTVHQHTSLSLRALERALRRIAYNIREAVLSDLFACWLNATMLRRTYPTLGAMEQALFMANNIREAVMSDLFACWLNALLLSRSYPTLGDADTDSDWECIGLCRAGGGALNQGITIIRP